MPRVLILLGVIVLGLVVLWAVSDGGGTPEGGLDGDAGTPLPYERPTKAADGAPPGSDAPTLKADTRAAERRAALAAKLAARAAAEGPTGPYDLTFIAWETDAPLENVQIAADVEQAEEADKLGLSDSDGAWTWADGGVTQLAFRARLEGYLTFRGVAFPATPQEVVLHAGVTIRGTVLRAGPDTPIPEASVRVWDVDLGREIVSTTTDEKGCFRLHAVRPNHPVEIVVTVEGLVPYHRTHTFEGAEDEYEITVGGGGHVRGRVLDSKGKPLPAVEVRLPRRGKPLFEQRAAADPQRTPVRRRGQRGLEEITRARTAVTHTDESGRYAFAGLALKVERQPVAIVGPRFLARADPVVPHKEGDILERDIHVPLPASLRIRVHDGLGTVLSHARLRITRSGGFVPLFSSDRWRDGALLLENLTPGYIVVRATLPGMPQQRGSATLKAGALAEIELKLPPGGELLGEVRDKRGAPIWQARVSFRATSPAEHVEMRTDEKGRFHLLGLRAEEGTLSVRAANLPYTRWGYESETREFTRPGEGRQVFTLRDGTRATGTFRELPKDAEVRSTMVVSLQGAPRAFEPLPLDGTQRFARRGPHAYGGAVRFIFRARGFAPLIVYEPNPFQSEEVRDLGSLQFERTNPRKGQVLGPGRKPLRGAKVSLDASWSSRTTRTDGEGRFVFARLPDRKVFLRIEADGFPAARVPFETGSQYVPQVIRLRPGRTVTIRVMDAQGRPAAGAYVELRGKNPRWKPGDPLPLRERVRPSGNGVVTRFLAYGTYDIQVYDPRTRTFGGATLSVKAGGRAPNVTVKLQAGKR